MRLTIGQKLSLVVLLLFGLHLVAFGISQSQLAAYRDNTLHLANENLPQLRALDRLSVATANITQQVTEFLASGDASTTTRLERDITEARSQVAQLLATAKRFNQALPGQASDLDRVGAQLEMLVAEARRLTATQGSVDAATLSAQVAVIKGLREQLFTTLQPLQEVITADSARTLATTQQNPLILPAILTGFLTLSVASLLWIVRQTVVRPIQKLTSATTAMAAGAERQEVLITAQDEIGQLARSFNAMTAAVHAQQQLLHERAVILEATNAEQERMLATIRELSVPTIPLGNAILLLPLIGYISAARAELLTRGLLEVVARQRIRTLILDCTGLTAPDTASAQSLMDMLQAARLMGASTILSGIRPTFAQTLSSTDFHLVAGSVCATVGDGICAAQLAA